MLLNNTVFISHNTDPYDCTKYFTCYNSNQPLKYKCPENYVYSSKLKLCERRTQYSSCEVVNCSGQNNKFIPYAPNPTYYAFCGIPIVMFKCGNETYNNYVFDSSVNDCVFSCQSAGYFAHPSDCTRYYICESRGVQGIQQECPYGFKFDGASCVKSENWWQCQNNPPDVSKPPIDITSVSPTWW